MIRNFQKFNANRFTPDPKPEKTIKAKKAYKYVKKPTGEKEVFKKIWEERGPYSQVSGVFLGEFNHCFFAHILPKAKNKYPHFKLNPENIVLMTLKEHHDFDFARHNCKGGQWLWVFEQEAILKEEYTFQHPQK